MNLEQVYITGTFIKILGITSLNQSYAPAQLNLDMPFFFSLNASIEGYTNSQLDGLLTVGANLRYEASLLNTIFRREQNQRGFSRVTIGAYNSLRYTQAHQGNSFRTLYSFIENRVTTIKAHLTNKAPIAILLGVNNLRNNQSFYLQQLTYILGKQFFVKLGKKDRIGYIHSSVGSLAFAYLGFKANTTITKNDSSSKSFFVVGKPDYAESYFK
jgi:hypothetical protein